MRMWKIVAMLFALVTGGLSAVPASATPVSAGALPAAVGRTETSLAEQAQFYYGGGGYYRARPRVVVGGGYYRPRPVYGYRRMVRPYYYRPARTVCRTRVRFVRTYYGVVRRPVQVCRRVY